MSNERGRIRRLRLIAGIIVGLVAGTAHALVTHVVARQEPAVTAGVPVRSTMGDLVVVDSDGRLLVVVLDEAGGDDDGTR